MSELLRKYNENIAKLWNPLEKRQKIMLIATFIILLISISIYTYLATRTRYELAFVGVNEKQAGLIVKKLDEMGVPYQLSAGGQNISVPESQVAKVKVTLAQEDVLGNGNIYSKFWDSASFGMTDSQFQVLERGAIEQELRDLIVNGIKGIKDANVMITLPKEKVFYSEDEQKATASVIVNIEPGVELNPNQIKSMYNLISKSVPNLPVENITIVDQYSEPLEYTNSVPNNNSGNMTTFDQQRKIQADFQQDLKKEIEKMLDTVLGPNQAIVTVFARMNFDQQKTVENLKEPVVDGKGIARSVEKIQESFTGQGNPPGGIAGTGNTQIPGYQAGTNSNGNYEHNEERINYEVNEITKEIVSSPYRLEDLSINVAINMPEDNNPNSKTGQTKIAIQNLIKPILLAALNDQQKANLNDPTVIEQKIAVIAHPFQGVSNQQQNVQNSNRMNPYLLYGLIGLSVFAVGGVGYTIVNRRRKRDESVEEEELQPKEVKTPEIDFTPNLTEEMVLNKEIQKLANQKPEEFVKLIRTWLLDE
ncbi:flagellar basal-body MS-ring/collar protein FliF [Tepidibacillus fermentans]|uniref:Flagellar M-ring protein n=1 Tax=Tepidibacillus fermentans TaxID=1281767 RepID=A0A4R3KHJ3_9BACI|nr:flagellar basal-body MS-ring/collar protein FliF [Tepidibacillus fermentans]TCS82935.1 flagellar M-ring protein FliF [Tepidibacillus fermentans]